MTKLSDLVHFVACLAAHWGRRSEAFEVARRFMRQGAAAFDAAGVETREFLLRRARLPDQINVAGTPNPLVAAELIRIAAVVREVPVHPLRPHLSSLVYTVSEDARSLVAPGQRLSYIAEDLIRMSLQSLRIGGPFWNENGFSHLLPVLRPAVEERGVICVFYVHAWEHSNDHSRISALISQVGSPPRVRTWWYHGPRQSLLHAKFVIADGKRGLLSTANLTSLGLGHHVEVGVPLAAPQCEDLSRFLDGPAALDFLRDSSALD